VAETEEPKQMEKCYFYGMEFIYKQKL